jgi:c-di-GMP-binding flagellar brake protein YcgR
MSKEQWHIVLDQLEGSSARVSLVSDQRNFWAGLLTSTDGQLLTVDLVDTPAAGLEQSMLKVDVLHHGGLYRFHSIGCSDAANRSRLQLHRPENIEVVQRRNHPRVGIAGDVAVWAIEGKELKPQPSGRAINISIGGLAFETTSPLPAGARIVLELRGGATRHLGVLEGEVLRVSASEGSGWAMAVAFRNIRPRTAADLFELVQTKLRMQVGFLESAVGFLE